MTATTYTVRETKVSPLALLTTVEPPAETLFAVYDSNGGLYGYYKTREEAEAAAAACTEAAEAYAAQNDD